MTTRALAVVLLGLLIPARQTPQQARIVSLVPAVTEMLYAIGAGPDVVGVSSFDRFPPEVLSKPRVGALIDPDVERILSLRPTAVIVYATQRDLIDRLARAGIRTFATQHGGLSSIASTIRSIGALTDRRERADDVARTIERDLDDIRRRVAGRTRPKTALVFGREPGSLRGIYASGGIGFMHDVLELSGGRDVFADVKRENLQVTTELMLARAPEVILEVRPSDGWTADRLAAERAVWRALPSLPAVKAGRVYLLADDRLSSPGPRIAEAARLIARTLHPDAFQSPITSRRTPRRPRTPRRGLRRRGRPGARTAGRTEPAGSPARTRPGRAAPRASR